MSARALVVAASAALAAGALAACAPDPVVTSQRADEIRIVVEDPDDPTTGPGVRDPSTDPSDPSDPDATSPTNEPIGDPDPDAIDFGTAKPTRTYDEFLLAVVTDLEQLWAVEFPAAYGMPFEPLQGEVYAAYPGRPDDIPGCGVERTSYQDVQQYVAFYCGEGDFLVYDDGDDGLLAELAREDGAATIGTVLAHEYGHAIQLRSGAIERNLPTIRTEQQADCFAGAWTARVAHGESSLVQFSDHDVRSGLIAMTKVSDPVGLDQFVPGGHGSAFDRVGAFQVGYSEGVGRCKQLLDDPLPLMPNAFLSLDDQSTGGDADFGYGDDELLGFIPTDLNRYWDEELGAEIPELGPLSLVALREGDAVECDDLRGDLDSGSALCVTTGEVYLNEPAALELYDTLGDFSVGYLLGSAWSEAVQESLGSDASAEERALLNDCLTGGWVKSVTPTDDDGDGLYELPVPRLEQRTVTISAGDLDEAIQTVLRIADADIDDDVNGNAFEKIAAFRDGVINGTDACLDRL